MSTLTSEIGGRAASIARRRALSAGKSALAPAAAQASAPAAPSEVPAAAVVAAPPIAPSAFAGNSAREAARARRAALSRHGRGNAPAAPPSRALRPETPANVAVAAATAGVTSSRVGTSAQVTGAPDVRFGSGLAARGASPKVGFSRTPSGLVVSGTQVRSSVRITGDEAGSHLGITGEADQRLEDDLTERSTQAFAQFPRRAEPHGASVFTARKRHGAALESTEGGLPVTGTAVGTSERVTGDEAWARGAVSGDQYFAPQRGRHLDGATRPDPVTGAKVGTASTRGGKRVTGISVDADARVTGDPPVACGCITGTQYGATAGEPREAADGFSVRSPQHSANGRTDARGITGSFAAGGEKITGNREFAFTPRAKTGDAPAARLRVTGEGRSGERITGGAWSEHPKITGTEGAFAGERNPSERAGKPQQFAGALRFKAQATREEPKRLVTGMSGYSSDSGARVTLSGGAHG